MKQRYKNTIKRVALVLLAIFVSGTISGCAATRHASQRAVISTLDTTVDDIVDNLLRTKNAAFVEDGLPGALLLITGLVELDPADYDLLSTTSFLYCAYGLFAEDDDPDYAVSLYRVGAEYGLRAMKVNNSKFRKALESGMTIADAAKYHQKNDLKGMTWYLANVGKRCTLQLDSIEETLDLKDAVATARRSIELDTNYAWGIGHILMGIFHSIIPPYLALGGGPDGSEGTGSDAAKEEFALANRAMDGKSGLTDVFQARYLAPLLKDREMFDQLLTRVIEMDSCEIEGGFCILNELAKKKAKWSIDHKIQYFGW
jgi:hypothetical protein